jgi:hypothetical protein
MDENRFENLFLKNLNKLIKILFSLLKKNMKNKLMNSKINNTKLKSMLRNKRKLNKYLLHSI